MSELPWMPFYVTDFVADTLHLDAYQFRAYVLLICHYWKHRSGPLNNIKMLHEIARWPSRKSVAEWQVVMEFFEVRDGKLFHSRIQKELQIAIEDHYTRVENGKKGAAARWGKSDGPATGQASGCPNSNHNQNHKEKVCGVNPSKPKRKGKEEVTYSSDFESFWNIYPKKVGKKEAYKSWNKLNPPSDLRQKILEAVEQQKQSYQWRRENGQFIPNPATWLNQGRWDDELDHVPTVEEMYGD